jgi:hypothetical protein
MKNSLLGVFILLLYINWLYGRVLEAYLKDTFSLSHQSIETVFSLINLVILLIISPITKFNYLIKYFYYFLAIFHALNLVTSIAWVTGIRKDKLLNEILELMDVFSTLISYTIVTFLCIFIYVVFVS